jgi:hypothetical protein
VHEILTIVITVLFAIQVGKVATLSDPSPMVDRDAWAAQPLSTDERPDVYLILADAHGRHDVLDRLYGYDDGPFLAALEALGFDVAPASRSNYALTRFALGSMFTSTYLDPLNTNDSTVWQDDFARRTTHDNPAFPLLRRAGYEVTVVSSGYEHLGLRSADRFVDTGQPNEFEAALIKNLAATAAWDAVQPDHAFAANRERARDERAEVLDRAGRPPQPRPVFAHSRCRTGCLCSTPRAGPPRRWSTRRRGWGTAAASESVAAMPPRRGASTGCRPRRGAGVAGTDAVIVF